MKRLENTMIDLFKSFLQGIGCTKEQKSDEAAIVIGYCIASSYALTLLTLLVILLIV
jgi:hypothetical protein